MKPYVKLYLDYHNLYGEFITCVNCGNHAVDIHHIQPKGMGGCGGRDGIDNLIALCRICHEEAHASILSKDYLRSLLKHKD
jgi:5-methylcytosine-specific restriction endonuclease McrA